ncbi:MAG TPA: OmpA family protein [Polyangiaceae bacterium]|nr:OmpA family protein [Polyangiaceae bacterium]
MNRAWSILLSLVMCAGCGVSRSDFDAKSREAQAARQEADAAKQQLARLQEQITTDQQQMLELKNTLGIAQSQAITEEQKSQLEEAKRAVEEAQERGKLLDDLQSKFKRMIDAGRLKVTTRHGRVVLQLHNDVLFDPGEAEVKSDGKQTLAEVAGTLRSLSAKRFQVAGHTDSEPLTPATKTKYPTNWELSAARAIAVVKLLVQSGVDPGILSAAGYGPYDPIASNAAAEGRSKNRRIEITLMPNVAQLVAAVEKK